MERRAGGERPRLEGSQLVKHRNVEYGVEEDVPGRWRYIIYPGTGRDERVYGDAKHKTREAAVQAAIYEIDNGLERARRRPSD
jgi:hypothetical protein